MLQQDGAQPLWNFLGNLPASQREVLLSLGRVREVFKGDHIFRSGAPGLDVYVLEEGRAKIYRLSDSGKEVIQWFCFPGEIFGLAELSRGGYRGVFAQACTDARVYSISRTDFSNFLKAHPDTALHVIDLLSGRMRVLGETLLNFVSSDVTSRVIKLLIRLCARYGKHTDQAIDLDIRLTHQEMADMIGATRQTVTSVLNNLRRRGALHMTNQHIQIRRECLLQSLPTCQTDA